MSLPFDLGPGQAAALGVALFGAAFVRGYSGFGFSAIFIAFAALITNPLPLIPVVFSCEMLMTVFQARGIRGHVDWRRVFALLAGAAIVLPFSVWAILSLGESTVRLSVSLIVLTMSLVLLSGWTLQRTIKAPGHMGVGMVSGLCNSAGIGGLPVAAFMTAQPMQAATFRATMIVYLTGLDLITMPLLWAGGLVTWETALGVALAFPLLGLGVWLGGRQFLAASPSTFRRFAVMLLLALSLLGLARAMMGI
ncbi:sulfite exporter TauE/SafE family protein [Yoonia sp. SS1-5]|uniref:Probable membrane transporter protein n=1 Tax=Yoonia rhodophyticola TaxID=3137370 RepID=A0AAN0MGW0_9RHOB